MTRIIATGDNHWDEHSRWEECLRVHSWIADLVERELPDAFLIGGDIYERASTPKERAAVAEWLTRIADVCPVVIAKGNHDRPQDLALLARLATRHPIIVEERAGVHYVAGIAVATMAWPSRATLLAAIDATDSTAASATERAALEAVLRGFSVELDEHHGAAVLLGHFMVDGSMTSVGQPLQGHAMNVSLSDLDLAGADIVLMSHVHAPQSWALPSRADAVYMGSPYRTTFGEVEAKSVTIVEWADQGHGACTWRRIETPARPMLLFTGAVTDIDVPNAEPHRGLVLDEGSWMDVAGAEIRLRYSVRSDEQDRGKTDASRWKSQWLDAGAVDVKLDPIVIPVVRARAPEIAKAATLSEKLMALWACREDVPDVARAAALVAKVAKLEDDLGIGRDAHGGAGVPRFDGIKIRGIGPFTNVDIDLAGIMGTLIAITGKNGAGKSSLLELLIGSIHRDTPTRGTIASLAKTRSSMLEVRVANGASYTVRHLLDSVNGKGESLVMDDAGAALTNAAQRREYDAWSEAHFAAPEVLFASTFAAQFSTNFVGMKAGERKRVLLRVLGIERYEELAKQASERARGAKSAADIAGERIAEANRGALPVIDARVAVENASIFSDETSAALDAARRSVSELMAAADEYDRTRTQRLALQRTIEKLEADREAVRQRAEVARELAARGPEIAEARERITRREASLETERAAEASAQRDYDAASQALRDAKRSSAERTIIEDRIGALDAELVRARDGLASLRPVIDRAEAIRDAQKRAVDLERDFAAAGEAFTVLQKAESDARAALGIAESALTAAKAKLLETDRTIDRLERRLADEDRVREAAEAEKVAAADVIRLRREREEVIESLRVEGDHALVAKDERIEGLRNGLDAIASQKACEKETIRGYAAGTLARDTHAATKDAEAPKRCEALRTRRTALQASINDAERRVEEHRRLAGQLDAITQARADLERATSGRVEDAAAWAAASSALTEAEARVYETSQAVVVAKKDGHTLKGKLAEARALAADAEELATAEARRTALEADVVRITDEQAKDRDALRTLPAVDTAALEYALSIALIDLRASTEKVAETTVLLRDDREIVAGADAVARAAADLDAAERDATRIGGELTEQRTALAAIPALTERPDVEDARQAEQRAQREASAAADALSRARVTLEASEAAAVRVAELQVTADAAYVELADWTRLAQDLGRDGIQALEIDAAGPELTAIANDLLHTCVSRRWTIAIHTQKLDSTGKRMLEGCEVEITDVEAGRVGAAETFSGGERVLIGEAVSLALSVLACRRAGVEGPTIVRDESGAALDAANGRAYVAMLRRACLLIGARQCLFVSHSPELQELADARIHIEHGTATVIA